MNAPEPPEQFFLDQGWTRGRGGWLKPNGEPVFFVDIINAYPPLHAWVNERTKCCRLGSCSAKPTPPLSDGLKVAEQDKLDAQGGPSTTPLEHENDLTSRGPDVKL